MTNASANSLKRIRRAVQRKKEAPTTGGERTIESFSSNVLAEYIKWRGYFLDGDIISRLKQIEAQHEHEALKARQDEILAEMPKYHGFHQYKQYKKLSDELDAVWKRQDELRAIMFPIAAGFLTLD